MPVEGSPCVVSRSFVLISAVLVLLLVGAPARAAFPPERKSPPGQIMVLTLNARQQRAVGLTSFLRLFQLVKSMRTRPAAFDGGTVDAAAAPDVIIFEEMKESNLEIIRRLLNQRTEFHYDIVSADPQASATFLVNSETMSISQDPVTVEDPCRDGGGDGPPTTYQVVRLTEMSTNQVVTIGGVHFLAQYRGDCRDQNVTALKSAVASDPEPVVIGGDFNQRPVQTPLECDPNEQSGPLSWWSLMTGSDGSRPFVDSVREFNRRQGVSFAEEWTFLRGQASSLCTGATDKKRSRLDYLFASDALVAEAHADHPGWLGEEPGSFAFKHPYSDHRWVWGRYVLRGPARPEPPSLTVESGGGMSLSWLPQEGVANWVLYRATGAHPYDQIALLSGDQTTFRDHGQDGVSYKYAIAPLASDGSQGFESLGASGVADSRGPRVEAVKPPREAHRVPRTSDVDVWFDEHIAPDSISNSTVSLVRKGRSVQGRVLQISGHQLRFNPKPWLKKDATYRVVVQAVRDDIGNSGARFSYVFHT